MVSLKSISRDSGYEYYYTLVRKKGEKWRYMVNLFFIIKVIATIIAMAQGIHAAQKYHMGEHLWGALLGSLAAYLILKLTQKEIEWYKESSNKLYEKFVWLHSGVFAFVGLFLFFLFYSHAKVYQEFDPFFTPIILIFFYILFKSFTSAISLKKEYPQLFSMSDDALFFSKTDITSYPNKLDQSDGYKWADLKAIKSFCHGNVYIDNFNVFQKLEEIVEPDIIALARKQQVTLDRIDFTKTITVLGAMGSGKTEFFHSILNQNAFNREIIHDVKGDFVEKWYNQEKDYILNPYDERGVYWDIWAEMEDNETLVESFIENLMETKTEEKDFFTGSAKKVIIDMLLKVHYTEEGNSSHKWNKLLEEIEAYRVASIKNSTNKSIYATMDLVIDLFTFMAWHSKQNKKSFTIKQYLEGSGRLFLLNNPSVSTKVTPLFTGFISILTEILLSKSDTKDNLSLLLLDEYLSMTFEKQTRLKLLTQIRSKGGCLIMGMQYLPKKDKEHQQLIDSSSYGRFIFQINEQETINHIISSVGEINFIQSSSSHSNSSHTESYTPKNKYLLTTEHLQSMPTYSHISIFFSEKILYLGYTPLLENLKSVNKNFIKIDQKTYYLDKYEINKDKEIEELKAEIAALEKDGDRS